MVELTEIKDENAASVAPSEEPHVVAAEPINATERDLFAVTKKEDGASDEDAEDDSDFEDDFNENETLLERFYALKEMIPPKQRQYLVNTLDSTTTFVKTAFSKGGNLAWALTTSALLLGVPLSLSILSEQQLIEMEKTFDLQKDANDLLGQSEDQVVKTA